MWGAGVAGAATRSRLIAGCASGGLLVRIAGLVGSGWRSRSGRRPRCSAGEAWQAFEREAKDALVGTGAWQMQHDAGLQHNDAGGELHQAQPQGVELGSRLIARARR